MAETSPCSNESENMTDHNLWDVSKTVLRGKFIAPSACIRKDKKSQIGDIN